MRFLYNYTSEMYKDAGTDVYIKLVGTKLVENTTWWILLDIRFNDDFKNGSTDVFNIKIKDIGTPKLVKIS